jgi:hypothetical protein
MIPTAWARSALQLMLVKETGQRHHLGAQGAGKGDGGGQGQLDELQPVPGERGAVAHRLGHAQRLGRGTQVPGWNRRRQRRPG